MLSPKASSSENVSLFKSPNSKGLSEKLEEIEEEDGKTLEIVSKVKK